jgi:bifunctional enzyme CysN/CysC
VTPPTESGGNGRVPAPAGETSELLRFATAGSVDDGKSTLIGRLLYDSKQIFQDQLEHVAKVSEDRGQEAPDLALLTDGLRAEREQGITIDVAYRYFSTPRRKFIIADTPGHISYTRNMVTGASTADLSIILVDARNGVVEQSRRHAFLNSLLNIPHHVTFIPMSALKGDNVVEKSDNMPWYKGPSLLYHLEHVHIASDRNLIDNRFPVQWVVRPQTDEYHDYRGYAGVVASGVFKVGDDVIVLPSKRETRIAKIDTFDGPLEEAFPPLSVTLLLEDDEDISRGDMICRTHNQPQEVREFEAMVCWMADEELKAGSKYAIKHTTRDGRAIVQDLRYKIDVNTLHRDHDATTLGLNDIGRVHLKTSTPLFIDEYRRSRATGSFILIDESTNNTVGAGMITGTESWAQPTQH